MQTADNVIDLDARRVAPMLLQGIEGFLGDPPEDEFQRGYLAALLVVYGEGLGRGKGDARVQAGERLVRAARPPR